MLVEILVCMGRLLNAVLSYENIYSCGISFIDCVKLNNFFQSFKQFVLGILIVQQAVCSVARMKASDYYVGTLCLMFGYLGVLQL